ncbi:MAG: T9SS type A sorting domain-containing protein, partial [Bacteroidota bacterium]
AAIQENKVASFNVYPNPTEQNLTVSISNWDSNTVLSIYNVHGQLVRNEKLLSSTQTIETTNLSAGLYHLIINQNGKTSTQRFVKK